MAGDDKPEFPALLPPGFHQFDIASLRRLCVLRFPDSITRPRIMENLSNIIDTINRTGIRGEVWIDGSFLTDKLNPDDVDLIFSIASAVFVSLSPDNRRFYHWFS
jgi:hypothetical protein